MWPLLYCDAGTSYQGKLDAAPQNLLNRDFQAGAPNRNWLTDITEFRLPAGKVYLSPVIDHFDGLVVSWSVGARYDADLVNTMLDAAVETITNSVTGRLCTPTAVLTTSGLGGGAVAYARCAAHPLNVAQGLLAG